MLMAAEKSCIKKISWLCPIIENIPTELKAFDQWVLWRAELREEKWTKVPYSLKNRKAKVNAPNTWGTFEQIWQAYLNTPGFTGVGFVLSENDPFSGFDIDKCRAPETGRVDPWALEYLYILNSYSETSPSQTGLRILVKGSLPPSGRRKGPVEMYETGRFLTITGHHLPNYPNRIKERTKQAELLHEKLFTVPKGKSQKKQLAENPQRIYTDDHTLLERAFKWRNGSQIEALFDGNCGGYSSPSEADQALCNYLSFLYKRDYFRIDAMFRSSRLYRKKWDEKHFSDGRTYGQATIEKAIAGTNDLYQERWQNTSTDSGQIKPNKKKAKSQWESPVNILEVLSSPPPAIKWLIDNRVPAGRGISITGLGGSSKTRILYSIAIGTITGLLPWSWKIKTTGKAILVLTEDTAADVHRVVWSLAKSLSAEDRAKLSEGLVIYPLAGKDTRLLIKMSAGTVEPSPLYHSLVEKINALGNVAFVGLDPALSITEGDELDQGHQRALGKAADDMAVKTGATVALVCHSSKGSLQKQELTSHNSRGGGAITDALRAEYSVRNMTSEEGQKFKITDIEERKRHLQLVCTKGNNVPPSGFVPVWLRRDDYGNLTEADIKINGYVGTLSERDTEILKVHTQISAFSTPKLSEWREKCVEKGLIQGISEDAQKQAMKRVLNKLLKAGRIQRGVGRGIYIQPPQTEELPF